MTLRDYAASEGITVPAALKRVKLGQVKAHKDGREWVIDVAPTATGSGESMDSLKRTRLKIAIKLAALELAEAKDALQLEGYQQAIEDITDVLADFRKSLAEMKLSKTQLEAIRCAMDKAISGLPAKTS
jgi:hypothetical protein